MYIYINIYTHIYIFIYTCNDVYILMYWPASEGRELLPPHSRPRGCSGRELRPPWKPPPLTSNTSYITGVRQPRVRLGFYCAESRQSLDKS